MLKKRPRHLEEHVAVKRGPAWTWGLCPRLGQQGPKPSPLGSKETTGVNTLDKLVSEGHYYS